jgi:hypothetical protein
MKMFEDLELNPMALAGGLLGGVLSLIVQSQVETGIVIKVLTFAVSTVVCYFMVGKILS